VLYEERASSGGADFRVGLTGRCIMANAKDRLPERRTHAGGILTGAK